MFGFPGRAAFLIDVPYLEPDQILSQRLLGHAVKGCTCILLPDYTLIGNIFIFYWETWLSFFFNTIQSLLLATRKVKHVSLKKYILLIFCKKGI